MYKTVGKVLLDYLYEKQASIDDCITTLAAAIEADNKDLYLRALDDIEDL